MKICHLLFIIIPLFIIGAVCCTGCTTHTEEQINNTTTGVGAESITNANLTSFVHGAADYARNAGKERALQEFSDKNGRFIKDNLYVYAYDFEGNLLAHPYQQEKVGTNRMNWTTSNGLRFFEVATATVQSGEGFLIYMYPKPFGSADIDEDAAGLYNVKIGYVEKVDDDWWIGSGVYLSDYIDESTGGLPEKISGMTSLVSSAVSFARENSTETLLNKITDQNGQFTDGNLYLYAYDYNGTLVAHPYLASGMIGKDLSGYVGPYGVNTITTLAGTAQNGGGYVVFGWENPANVGKSELKLGYVEPVDENCWVGSGIYLSDMFNSTGSGIASQTRTLGELVGFVGGAYDHAESVGKEQAISDFGDQNGDFVDGNLYLYVEDFSGVNLAHPIHPQTVGVSRMNATDPRGLYIFKGLCDTVADGDGYFMFLYANPSNGFTCEPKMGYVRIAPGDDWWIGSGVYLSEIVSPETGKPLGVLENLTAFVNGAKTYACNSGMDAALSEFAKPGQSVYAFDYDGVLLADASRSDDVGQNLTGLVGQYGVSYVAEGSEIAGEGGGYLIYTPAGSDQRLDYILPVDENYWIGAGVPVSEIVEEGLNGS